MLTGVEVSLAQPEADPRFVLLELPTYGGANGVRVLMLVVTVNPVKVGASEMIQRARSSDRGTNRTQGSSYSREEGTVDSGFFTQITLESVSCAITRSAKDQFCSPATLRNCFRVAPSSS